MVATSEAEARENTTRAQHSTREDQVSTTINTGDTEDTEKDTQGNAC